MSIFQLLLFGAMLMATMVVGYVALSGPSPAKEGQRRLSQLRYRHSESTDAKVESQLKKAIAQRRPKMYKVAGSGSKVEALAGRLDRTGKGWTVTQYFYASLGIALAVTVIVFLRSGAPLLSLAIGLAFGAGIPHFVVNHFIKRRTNQFNAKFPDAIELLVRGLRSGLPVDAQGLGPGLDPEDENHEFIVQVWTNEGLRIFESAVGADLPQVAVLGFANVQARGALGFNVPSLISVFASAPYLHSGAAASLDDVLRNVTHRTAGRADHVDLLGSALTRRFLVQFLRSIDRNTEPILNVTPPANTCGQQ